MLKDGQPEGDERRDGCPVVWVQEHSKILQSVLSFIYPVDPPILDEIPDIQACLAAALKYNMKRVVSLTRTALRSIAREAPLRAWAVAVQNGLEVEARVAAAEAVRQGISVLDDFPPEMQELSAGPYFRLLQYERLAGNSKMEQDDSDQFVFCDPPVPSTQVPQVDPGSSPVLPANPQISSQSYDRIRSLGADVIIRSADGHEFPVHKALLSLASPPLAALLLAHPVRDEPGSADLTADITPLSFTDVVLVGDSLPQVVPLDEDAVTLAVVLGLCYPPSEGEVATGMEDIQVLQGVTDAVKKYEMDGVKRFLQDQWEKASTSDPLRAFIVATRHGADAEARKAARMLLDRKLEDYYSSILEVSSVSAYRRLVKYERACRKALQQAVQAYLMPADPSVGKHLILPVKSAMCRVYYLPCTQRRHFQCRGVSDLDSQGACDPCLSLAATIAGVLRRLETEPDVLMTILESRDATSTSQTLLCALCSRQDDFVKLKAIYDDLYTLAKSLIDVVRMAFEH